MVKRPNLHRIDPKTLFPGSGIGRKTLLETARWEVGGYLVGRTFYLSDEQIAELIECFKYKPYEPFKPPLRPAPPHKQISPEDRKLFDTAIATLRREIEEEKQRRTAD